MWTGDLLFDGQRSAIGTPHLEGKQRLSGTEPETGVMEIVAPGRDAANREIPRWIGRSKSPLVVHPVQCRPDRLLPRDRRTAFVTG